MVCRLPCFKRANGLPERDARLLQRHDCDGDGQGLSRHQLRIDQENSSKRPSPLRQSNPMEHLPFPRRREDAKADCGGDGINEEVGVVNLISNTYNRNIY